MGVWDWAVFVIYYVSFVAIVIGYAWTVVLFVTGGRYLGFANARQEAKSRLSVGIHGAGPQRGLTIADSVERLRGVGHAQDHPGDQ